MRFLSRRFHVWAAIRALSARDLSVPREPQVHRNSPVILMLAAEWCLDSMDWLKHIEIKLCHSTLHIANFERAISEVVGRGASQISDHAENYGQVTIASQARVGLALFASSEPLGAGFRDHIYAALKYTLSYHETRHAPKLQTCDYPASVSGNAFYQTQTLFASQSFFSDSLYRGLLRISKDQTYPGMSALSRCLFLGRHANEWQKMSTLRFVGLLQRMASDAPSYLIDASRQEYSTLSSSQ